MLRKLLNQYKWQLIIGTILSTVSSFAGMGMLLLINREIADANTEGLMQRAILFAVGVLTVFIVGISSNIFLTKVSLRIITQLRKTLIARILNTEYAIKERLDPHRLTATVANDVSSITTLFSLVPVLVSVTVTIVLIFAYFFYLSPIFFAILITVTALALGFTKWMSNMGKRHYAKMRELQDDLYSVIRHVVEGGKELSTNENRRRHFYNEQTIPATENLRATAVTASYFYHIISHWNGTLLFVCVGMMLFGANLLYPVPDAVLVGYTMGMFYAMGPIATLTQSIQQVDVAKVAIKKLESLALTEQTGSLERYAQQQIAPDENWQQIKFEALFFEYQDKYDGFHFSVGPMDLTINRGELLFVCGANGSGKSTFAKLLTGLYQPTSGAVYLDKTKVDKQNLRWYQNHFSTIFTDFHLFEHVLDKQGELVKTEEIYPMLKELKLDGKVAVKDGKLSTTKLSDGQRKRLAMLLALMDDSPCYVFDEWAATQDPYFRRYFYTELLPKFKQKGKTVIVISHDERYFYTADRILQFEFGQVKQSNKLIRISQEIHDKLIADQGEAID